MSWTITATQNEEAWLDDYCRDVIAHSPPPLPDHDQQHGHVESHWHQVEPGVAFVATNPDTGTYDDRRLVEAVVMAQLRPHGYKRAVYTPSEDSMRKTADWSAIMAKAKRLIQQGKVLLLRNSAQTIVGEVQGDHGTYQPEISREDPTSQSMTGSKCQCDWGNFQNQPRTRQWKQYQDRPCLLGTSLIALADGSFKPIQEISEGEWVLTHDGVGQVTEVMRRPYQGDLIHLNAFGTHIPLTLTPEHEVWAYGTPQRLHKPWQETNGQSFNFYDERFLFDSDPEWIDAKDIKRHDWLTTPIPLFTSGQPFDLKSILPEQDDWVEENGRLYRCYTKTITRKGTTFQSRHRFAGSLPRYIEPSPALMKILGIFVAEGNIVNQQGSPAQIQWSMNLNEQGTLAVELIEALKEFDPEANEASVYERPSVNGLSVRLTHHPLALLLHHLAGHGATRKQWHPWVMALSPTDQEIILRWHREGDGHENDRWHIDTASDALALQTRMLLLRCGKLPSINHQYQKGGPTNRGKRCEIYRVSWVDVPQKSTNGQRRDPQRDFAVGKVSNITTSAYEGEVFNLSVHPQQSYVADGRIVHNCAHILATWWQAQATPTDEARNPGANGPGQMALPGMDSPGPTGAPPGMPMMQAPQSPSAPPAGGQGQIPGMDPNAPQMGAGGPTDPSQGVPSPVDVLPQFIDPTLEMPHNPASVPGLRQPSPTNPIQYPGGTFSSWQHTADDAFTGALQNGDIVQLNHDDDGTLVGRSEAHGAGQTTTIPAKQMGEVLGTHPSTGMINVLYTGSPWDKNGELEPFGAQAWHWPSSLTPRPDVPKPGPAIRRRR